VQGRCRKRSPRALAKHYAAFRLVLKMRPRRGGHRGVSSRLEMATYRLRINGVERTIESSDPDQPLLYGLRGLGLTATKFGCGLGQCGACSILLDGRPTRSCL